MVALRAAEPTGGRGAGAPPRQESAPDAAPLDVMGGLSEASARPGVKLGQQEQTSQAGLSCVRGVRRVVLNQRRVDNTMNTFSPCENRDARASK